VLRVQFTHVFETAVSLCTYAEKNNWAVKRARNTHRGGGGTGSDKAILFDQCGKAANAEWNINAGME
jgi:hypothetical protein